MRTANRRFLITVAMAAVASWTLAGRIELFETVHEFSRAYEHWDIDEILGFLMLMGAVLPVILGYYNVRLQRSLHEQRRAESQASHLSRHDALTGLFNRRVMNAELARRIERARHGGAGAAVLLLDLDRFKPVNDLRGHDVGDMILIEVARRIRSVCDPLAVPVRLGGDEFAVVVDENAAGDAATRTARRILAALETKVDVGDSTVSIGASIGIALWHEGIDEFELLRHADQAMYRSKREGRGRYSFFDDALGERLREAADLEAELAAAIEARAIVPFFQPIVDMTRRKLVGFEVLARWHHERFGWVPPDRFIALAEETGQIAAVSWLVLRQACETAREWDSELSIAFNLSPRQFRDRDLTHTISRVLKETGFPAARLEIEITETAVIENLEEARETIEQLRWLGIRISLDDFGTGFSSLATLSKLPFDKLKIDRSFISRVTEDQRKAKIVEGIISLAGSLDLRVTAEGIETEDAYQMLNGLHCELGQGYLFERPLPRAEIEALLANGWRGLLDRRDDLGGDAAEGPGQRHIA